MRKNEEGTRGLVAREFTLVADVVYVGLGALLAISAVLLLVSGAVSFAHQLTDTTVSVAVIGLLDRLLLTLMIVELLYTVQLSFREHALVPGHFSSSASSPRRCFVLAAESGNLTSRTGRSFPRRWSSWRSSRS